MRRPLGEPKHVRVERLAARARAALVERRALPCAPLGRMVLERGLGLLHRKKLLAAEGGGPGALIRQLKAVACLEEEGSRSWTALARLRCASRGVWTAEVRWGVWASRKASRQLRRGNGVVSSKRVGATSNQVLGHRRARVLDERVPVFD